MRYLQTLLVFVLALPMLAGTGAARATEVQSVEALDITRYAGTWHEIARLPMFFQRKCVAEVTAQYTLQEDGTLGVRNSCRNDNGQLETVDGVARRDPEHPGRLEVRFAPDWLDWLPLTWADYWVIAIDPDYQWAMVGEPGRDYLWILARTPDLPAKRFEAIKQQAEAMGYALDELIVAGQPPPADRQ
jgi:apolipoprotein D and lipocalin family protein